MGDTMSQDTPQEVGTLRRWLASLAFWTSLLVATLLYAAVTLAPKVVAYVDLRDSHYRNQVDLVALERDVNHLEKVEEALEHDPQFAAELARINFDAVHPGEERIAVDRALNLDATPSPPPPGRRSDYLDPYLPHLRLIAGDSSMRTKALAAAATITIVAFTFFHTGSPLSAAAPSPRRRLLDRYRKNRAA